MPSLSMHPLPSKTKQSRRGLVSVAALLCGASLFALSVSASIASATPITLASFGYTGNIVDYTIPTTGLYEITAAGAQGGNGGFPVGTISGGYGALISGEFDLVAGTNIQVAVGEMGGNGPASGGGGGGSFVVLISPGPTYTPLVIAGGGGGGRLYEAGGSGLATTGGDGNGGGGGGGVLDGGPGGGGGFFSNGGNGISAGQPVGISTGGGGCDFADSLCGGIAGGSVSVFGAGALAGAGGFGGGGGGGSWYGIGDDGGGGGGGGGGYSGGYGDIYTIQFINGGEDFYLIGGGGSGGGSYDGGIASDPMMLEPGVNSGDGYVSIDLLSVPEPNSIAMFGMGLVLLSVFGVRRRLEAD